MLVADLVERRQDVRSELAGFLQHGGREIGVEIAIMAGLHGGLEARAMVERQQHVRNRRAVGHGSLPGTNIGAVFSRNGDGLNWEWPVRNGAFVGRRKPAQQ